MSADTGHIVMFGVKTSFDKIFETVEEEVYGCLHEEKINAYCPLCGKKAKHIIKKTAPTIPLKENFGALIMSMQPVLNGKYFVHYEMHGITPKTDVYIGVTTEMLPAYGYGSCHEITANEIASNVKECEGLVEILYSHGIDVSIEDCKLHIIGYIS